MVVILRQHFFVKLIREIMERYESLKSLNSCSTYLNIIILICFKLCVLYKLFKRFPVTSIGYSYLVKDNVEFLRFAI